MSRRSVMRGLGSKLLKRAARPGARVEALESRELLAAQVYSGPLTGKVVYTSAGHGWQYNETLRRYATDRGDNNEIVEDFGNQDQLAPYADYLLRAGATVVPMRPVGHQTREIVLDNDSAGVTFTGSWVDGTSTPYYDEDYGAAADGTFYRYAATTAGSETAVATYQPSFAAEGFYPVYTWALSGANRTTQLYRINHTGGSTEIRVDHRMVGKGWVYLGTYHFNVGSSTSGNVQVSNNSPVSGNVIADAIRFGNGMGDFIDTGAGATAASGYPREDENSYHWIRRSLGQGVTVSGSIGTTSNVSAPSEMAQWMHSGPFGSAVYIGFHSNAGGNGRGAVGLIDADQGTPNQGSLALYTGRQINLDMQALSSQLEHPWSTRTTHTYTSGFGEIDLGAGAEMDATIIETAFHDSALDAALMRDPKVRDQLARSTYEATLEYFDNFGGLSAPASQPDEPTNVRATVNAAGDVTVTWQAPTSRTGGPGAATAYRVYRSANGYGFGEPVPVTGATSLTIPAAQLDGNAHYFKVAAVNAGGESPGSAVVGARKNGAGGGGGTSRVLIVNGFDRHDRAQNQRYPYAFVGDGLVDRVRPRYNNTFDYAVRFGEAVEAYTAGGTALGFDTVQNDHVVSGAVNLASYQTVLWISGNESTTDESFNASEQSTISTFLSAGGRLFVSGSEIAWDLDGAASPAPSAADRAFLNNTLRADYVNDDAGTYNAAGVANSIFAGVSLTFDDGANANDDNVYNVASPDTIAAAGGSTIAMNYSGGSGGGAAVQWADPASGAGGARVVAMGFPFETITTAANRNAVMAKVLGFFQTAVSAAPSAPDLVAATDSGISPAGPLNADNITNRDNSTSSSTLQFSVSGTSIGTLVTIYANGVAIGSRVANGPTTTVTTNGTTDLADGTYVITARQTEAGKSESVASAPLTVTIDTTVGTSDVVDVSPDPRTTGISSLGLTFSEPVVFMGMHGITMNRVNSAAPGPQLTAAAHTPTTADNVHWTVPNLLELTSIAGSYNFAMGNAGWFDLAGNNILGAQEPWVHALPTWLSPSWGGNVTWNSLAKTLDVVFGVNDTSTTITADPGPDLPHVTVRNSSHLAISPGAAPVVVNLASLTLSNSARVQLTASGAAPGAAAGRHALVIENAGGLSISAATGAKLDLNDNALVVRNTALAAVQALVTSGNNGGLWNGAGLTSGLAAADPAGPLAVGYASGAQLGVSTFNGVAPINAGDVVLRATYDGDTNLDGLVNTDDILNILSSGKLDTGSPATWFDGDFTFDGRVDTDDILQLLASGQLDAE